MTIRVRDIVQYLSTLDQDAEVGLDKDGWMEHECSNPDDPQTIIRERGLFNYWPNPKYSFGPLLCINN